MREVSDFEVYILCFVLVGALFILKLGWNFTVPYWAPNKPGSSVSLLPFEVVLVPVLTLLAWRVGQANGTLTAIVFSGSAVLVVASYVHLLIMARVLARRSRDHAKEPMRE